MKDCVTHHHACDCREAEFAALRERVARYDDLAEQAADEGAGICDCGRSYLDGAERMAAELASLREQVATLEGEIDDLHRYRDEWIAERERRTELERGIKRTADFIRDQDRVMADALDALLDASHDQGDDTEAR